MVKDFSAREDNSTGQIQTCIVTLQWCRAVVINNFLESNGLFPENQHGFRAKCSTMSAWANIQQEWALYSAKKAIKDFVSTLPI